MEEYEEQLKQIQVALESVQNEDDRKNLESLANDLKQLISLTFLESLEGGDELNVNEPEEVDSSLSKLVSKDII